MVYSLWESKYGVGSRILDILQRFVWIVVMSYFVVVSEEKWINVVYKRSKYIEEYTTFSIYDKARQRSNMILQQLENMICTL